MKWTIIALVVFASTFVVGAVPQLQAEKNKDCSNASLQGGYGFHTVRLLSPPEHRLRPLVAGTSTGRASSLTP